MQEIISRYRIAIAVLCYGMASATSFLVAMAVYEGGAVRIEQMGPPMVALVLLRLISHRLYRLTTSRWRYAGVPDMMRLVASTTAASVVFIGLDRFGAFATDVPWPVLGLEWVLSIFATSTLWITYRVIFEHFHRGVGETGDEGATKRTLVVGAGEAGNLLAREILRTPAGMQLVGFLDDDPLKRGTYIQGVRVLGPVSALEDAEALGVQRVIVAIPSLEASELRRIVELCEHSDVEYRVLPGIKEVLRGNVSVRQLRKVTIEDLLGREPVSVELPELAREMDGSVVLVTGAGGSIGSELARQIAANQPSELILLDKAESDLFFTELAIRDRYPRVRLRTVVGDVCDEARMERLFNDAGVTHLYHAAAYKHVPLMEENVSEAVRNNVRGTRILLELAGRLGLESFVLISTDKAVRPSSVMGATKRLCEVLLLSAAKRHRGTRYTAVRFGNVLGSNGSVVQVFRKQLESGTLTVTHPEITRYFMTVGEAVQLVLLASTLPEARGRIAMLEMGDPIRIVDLARNMIRLSGLVEGRDVRIRISGLRKGEKLHEELVAPFETTETTQNGKIQLVSTEPAPQGVLQACDELLELAEQGHDDESRALLLALTASEEDGTPFSRGREGEDSGVLLPSVGSVSQPGERVAR